MLRESENACEIESMCEIPGCTQSVHFTQLLPVKSHKTQSSFRSCSSPFCFLDLASWGSMCRCQGKLGFDLRTLCVYLSKGLLL